MSSIVQRFLQAASENAEEIETAEAELKANEDRDLLISLETYGGLFVVLLLVFCVLRPRYQRVYNIRNWVERFRTPLAEEPYGFVSWIWRLFSLSDMEVMEECGMDAVCFIRVLEFGMKISAAGAANAIWLMIVYGTEPEPESKDSVLVGLSTANLPFGSKRLIATAISAYIIFGYCMYLILKEFEWFISFRHIFLCKKLARNYTVYIQNIPAEFRNNSEISEFFSKAYEDSVVEAHLAVDCPVLKKKVAERDGVVVNLEHQIVIKEKTGVEPLKKNLVTRAVEGNLIDSLRDDLTGLNKDVSESIEKIITKVNTGEDTESVVAADTEVGEGSKPTSETDDQNAPISTTNRDESISSSKKLIGGMTNVVGGAVGGVTNVVGGAVGGVTNVAKGLLTKEDGEILSAGFVSFKTLRSTHAALQMIQYSFPFSMEVLEAPQPEDVFWNNVGKTHKELQIAKLVTTALTVALCLLWTIPMTFISSLSSIEGLRNIEFIDDALTASPWLVPLVAQIAPLMIVVAKQVLKLILETLAAKEGLISGAELQASFFTKFAWFIIIQTFFVSAISGGIMEQLNLIVDQPTLIIDILGKSLPAQSTKFVQILLVDSSITLGVELLRISPVAIAIVRSKVGPNLSTKEANTTWMGLRPLADPEPFRHGYVLGNSILYFMVFFVYSIIAPFTTFFVGICFFFMAASYRHQFVYIYPTFPDSGGKLWANFFRLIPFCMTIAQVTQFGMISLKLSPIAAALMIPLIIITILFNIYIKQQHFRMTAFLPARDAIVADQKNLVEAGDENDSFYDFLRDKYIQPELSVKEKLPDNDFTSLQVGQGQTSDAEAVEHTDVGALEEMAC